jgi:hypothetical protein
MQTLSSVIREHPASALAEPGHLARCLGTAEGLVELAQSVGGLCLIPVQTAKDLQECLQSYRELVLFPLEWPTILKAYHLVLHNQIRELVALDRELSVDAGWRAWRSASAAVGQVHLRALRPLKDHRVVQRYWSAVEHGEAEAFHPLVYGLILAVYSLPLRQGLLHYGWITLNTRAWTAGRHLGPAWMEWGEALDRQLASLPDRLDSLLGHPPYAS